MKAYQFIILISIISSACHRPRCPDVTTIDQVCYWPQYQSLEPIIQHEKKFIPVLIDKIDIDSTSLIGFKNPLSSTIENWRFNKEGIFYAYAIELILSQNADGQEHNYEWKFSRYQIYPLGIIAKCNDAGQPMLEPLSMQDMKKIQIMYHTWWEEHKNKSIDELRSIYIENTGILDYPYVWL